MRVLIAEDHEDTGAVYVCALRARGHAVTLARTVAEATAACATLPPFDVLIADAQLPDGDGRTLLEMVRACHPARGVVISGHGFPADRRKSWAAGFERHLTKPVELYALFDAVEGTSRDSQVIDMSAT